MTPVAAGAHDTFTIAPEGGGRISLTGSTPATVVNAFSYYLEHVAHGQLSRGGDNIPASTPEPAAPISKTTPYQQRYVYNETAQGYTQAYWNWDQWQRELDLDASEGVNTVLVQTGVDQVMYDTLRHFGYSDTEARGWIALPSQQGWQWMGNLHNDGPAIPLDVIRQRALLGQKIVARIRQLGMTPVLPGFGDAIPNDFGTRNGDPSAAVVQSGTWNGMPRPAWFNSTTPLYATAAAYYYRRERDLFGPIRLHDLNLNQEGGNTGNTSLADAAAGVAAAMQAADPDYTWVMLAWSGPTPAELTKLDKNHILVDCSSLGQATNPQWNGNPFGGAPWMFGEIGDFGGNSGLGGDLPTLATTQPNELANPQRGNLIGTSYIPEDTQQNPINERLWADMIWESAPIDLSSWITGYVAARYGTAGTPATAAWQELLTSAYQAYSRANSLFDAAPDLSATRSSPNSNTAPLSTYSIAGVSDAWTELLAAHAALGGLATYQHDLVDVTRQVISDQTRPRLADIKSAATSGDTSTYQADTRSWLRLMQAEEQLLATRPETMLGTWITDARRWGTTPAERDTMEYDARRILTVWDTQGSISGVADYANREWSGLMGDYYLPRWNSFFQHVATAMADHTTLPTGIDWRPNGRTWIIQHGGIPTRPTGNSVTDAQAIAQLLSRSKQ